MHHPLKPCVAQELLGFSSSGIWKGCSVVELGERKTLNINNLVGLIVCLRDRLRGTDFPARFGGRRDQRRSANNPLKQTAKSGSNLHFPQCDRMTNRTLLKTSGSCVGNLSFLRTGTTPMFKNTPRIRAEILASLQFWESLRDLLRDLLRESIVPCQRS